MAGDDPADPLALRGAEHGQAVGSVEFGARVRVGAEQLALDPDQPRRTPELGLDANLGETPSRAGARGRARPRQRPRPAPGRPRKAGSRAVTSPARGSSPGPARCAARDSPGRGPSRSRAASTAGRSIAERPGGPDGESLGVLGSEPFEHGAVSAEDPPLLQERRIVVGRGAVGRSLGAGPCGDPGLEPAAEPGKGDGLGDRRDEAVPACGGDRLAQRRAGAGGRESRGGVGPSSPIARQRSSQHQTRSPMATRCLPAEERDELIASGRRRDDPEARGLRSRPRPAPCPARRPRAGRSRASERRASGASPGLQTPPGRRSPGRPGIQKNTRIAPSGQSGPARRSPRSRRGPRRPSPRRSGRRGRGSGSRGRRP